jgi:hypothetical protein
MLVKLVAQEFVMVAEVLQQLLLKTSKFLDKKKEVAKQPLLLARPLYHENPVRI